MDTNNKTEDRGPEMYEPYGVEWRAQVMRLPKTVLVEWYRDVLLARQAWRDNLPQPQPQPRRMALTMRAMDGIGRNDTPGQRELLDAAGTLCDCAVEDGDRGWLVLAAELVRLQAAVDRAEAAGQNQ